MRAKDFIAYNKLKFAEELKTTIDRFSDIRKDFSKTDLYYTSHLREPDKWVKFIENCLKKKVDSKKHWDFIQELESCISSDASFTYLFRNLTRKSKEEKNITTAEQIEQYIANQFENYPCHCIDDFLTNQINDNFIKTLDTRDYTEQQELEIFHTAYRLFDDIRQQLQNTRHATHIYKEFKMQTEQMKDDTLRLLSYYVHVYNYDITDYQREKLNAISDHLGRYIQQRYKKHEETYGKWESLKCTIDNMISDDEKLKLLISERTEFLQLPQDKQRLIDPQFAEKCQLEIEKIKEIQSISQKHPETDLHSPIFLSQAKGTKVNFIRIVNVLSEMGFFVDKNGNKCTKKDIFRTLGMFVNKDLSSFQNDLSTTTAASNADMKNTIKIFEDMLAKQKEINRRY